MHKLYDLRDTLMDALDRQMEKPLSDQSLTVIDKLVHSIKCIDSIITMGIDEQSGESREGYSGRRTRDGYSGRRYFYTQREGGTSGLRRRDTMGRYADGFESREGYSGRYSRDDAKDMLIGEMEGMMNDVSPETQKAIEKAIHALSKE